MKNNFSKKKMTRTNIFLPKEVDDYVKKQVQLREEMKDYQKNSSGVFDNEDDTSEWLELYNEIENVYSSAFSSGSFL